MYISGIDPTAVRTNAEGPAFTLGTVAFNQTSAGPKGYIYVKASGAITGDGYVCLVDGSDFTAAHVTTTTSAPGAGAGKMAGAARAAIADTGYGWLQVFGAGTVKVLASCAAYTLINTTATAGALDDDASAGAEVVDGITCDAADGGSGGLVAGWFNWPKVGRTL